MMHTMRAIACLALLIASFSTPGALAKCDTCDARKLAAAFVAAGGRGQVEVLHRLINPENKDMKTGKYTGVEIDDYDVTTMRTVLLEGARWGHKEVVDFAIDHGADIHWTDSYDMNVCHHAAAMNLDNGVILEQMIAHFGTLHHTVTPLNNKCVHAKDYYGQTPLHHAAARGHSGTVTLLLESGANADAKDAKGKTARDLATGWFSNHDDVLAALDAHKTKQKRARKNKRRAEKQKREAATKQQQAKQATKKKKKAKKKYKKVDPHDLELL